MIGMLQLLLSGTWRMKLATQPIRGICHGCYYLEFFSQRLDDLNLAAYDSPKSLPQRPARPSRSDT